MAGKKECKAPAGAVAHYDRLIATCPEVVRQGAGVPYTSFQGNMFSFLHETGELALRLPSGLKEEFLEKYAASLFRGYGVVQKEYVTVSPELLGRTEELAPYFAQSFAYSKELRPKKKSAK